MLTVSRNRQPLTRTAAAFTVAGMFAVAVPLAAVTLTERRDSPPVAASARSDIALALSEHQRVEGLVAPEPATMPPIRPIEAPRRALPRAAAAAAPQAPASVSGVVRDTSGAVLPGVQLTLTNTKSGTSSSTTSDGTGSFALRDLAPSGYRLEAKLPGFASLLNELTLASGENVQRMLTLRVGSLAEAVTVTCAPAAARVAPQPSSVLLFDARSSTPRLVTREWSFSQAPAAQVLPIRVGGQIAAPRRTKAVQPVCPSAPIGSGGVVILEATLGVDGLIKDVRVLRSAPGRPDIDQSAINAIRQWEYTPTRLNNVPVAVIMTVTVVYAPI